MYICVYICVHIYIYIYIYIYSSGAKCGDNVATCRMCVATCACLLNNIWRRVGSLW